MRQDDRSSVLRERALDHLTRIYAGSIDGAVKQRCSSI